MNKIQQFQPQDATQNGRFIPIEIQIIQAFIESSFKMMRKKNKVWNNKHNW